MALTEKQKEMANAIMKSGKSGLNSGGSSGGSGQKSMFASSLSDDEKEIARLALQKVAKKDDYETVSEMKNAYETVNTLTSRANDRESRITLQKAKYALQDSAVRALGLYGDSMGTQDRNIAAQALEISKSEREQDITRLWDKSEELQQAGKRSGVKESSASVKENPVILTDENGTSWKLATKKSTAGRKTGATGILSGSVGVKRDGATLYGFQKSLSGYKTYHQETVPAQDKDTSNEKHTIRNLKANTDIQLQRAAIETISENAGKTYYELKDAYDGSDDSTYIGAYKKLVLEQLLQDSRTSEIITGEIDEAQAALLEVYAQAQQTTDSVVLTKLKSQSRALREQIDTLTGERWTVQQKKKYEAIPTYSDFAKNSVANEEGKGKKNDQRYLYINNINGARGTLSAQAMIGGRESYEPYSHMTETEIGIYNYLYNVSGKKDANGYLEYLIYDLNERSTSEIYDSIAQWTQESKWNAVGGSVASVITNLSSGIGYMDVLGQKTAKNITGSEKPVDYNKGAQTGYVFSQGVRDTVLKNINSNAGRFIYSTAMSMADSLGVMAASTVIGPAATVLLGGSAATSTMHEVREKGGTERQALAMGFAAGAAETLAEKLPLENLMNMKSAVGLKDVFINIMKQAGVEASEEFITSLANTASETLILGDKSSLQESYNEYLSQGYTPEEAEKKAKADWVRDIALDAAGGFVSGLLFAGGKLALNARGDARRGKNISSSEYTLDVLIDEVIEGDYSDGLKEAARELRTKQYSGDKISNGEKGRFASLIEQDNPNFVFEVLPSILEKAQQLEDMEAERERKIAYNERLGKANEAWTKFAIAEAENGDNVAIIDNDILRDIDISEWNAETKELAKKAAKNALLKFKDGVTVNESTRKVNKKSRDEYTRSNYTEKLFKKSPETFADKMRFANNLDDVLNVAKDWESDGTLKHDRQDNLVDFEKGKMLVQSGDNKYSATVVVGITSENERVFYDLTDIKPTDFNIKKGETPSAATETNSASAIQENSHKQNLSQSTDNVNTKFETTENLKGEKENARGISGEAGTEAGDSESILSDGGRGRFSETYTGEGRPIQERDGSDDVERAKRRAQKASKRQSAVAALRGEAVSAASLGIKNGSDSASARIMPESTYDNELRSIKRAAAEDGIDVQFFVGGLTLNDNSDVDAVAVGDKFYIKADKTTVSASELYDHERFHKSMRKNKNVVKALALWITKNFNGETFSRVFNKYYDKYAEAYKLSGMTPEEASFEVVEEMLADAYAGINRMGEDIKEYTTVARVAAEDTDGAGISEYNVNQGRAPPQGITYEGIKQAIREIVQEINADTAFKNKPGYKNEALQLINANSPDATTEYGSVVTSNNNMPENADNVNTKFAIAPNFYDEFDSWDGKDPDTTFTMGTTSEALQSIGMKNQEIIMRSGMILNKINKHTEITRDIFRQIPQLLENPVLIQFSDAIDRSTGKPKYNDSITVWGELYAEGKPVLVAMNLVPKSRSNAVIQDFAVVKSAYTKNSMQQYINENSILYVDPNKKRTDNWLSLNGLQLPVGENQYGSLRKITYDGDKVKVQNSKSATNMERALKNAGVVDDYGNVNTKFALSGDERVSQQEIDSIQSIGRKSVNDFSSEEIQKTERYARRYWNEMGTKSPFFRSWFGDWRAYDTSPVKIATEIGAQRGSQYNNDTGWEISISGKVFNETHAHVKSVNVSARPYLDYINDIVKKAVLLDSYGVGKAKSANTLLMHSMYAVADIGNGPEVLKLYVEEMNDPNSADTTKRSYQLQNIEKYRQSSAKGSGISPSPVFSTADVESVSDLFEYVKGKDPNFKPKQTVRELLNNDGTPMVLYHGTENAFFEFKNSEISSREGSFFFAQNYEDAAAYSSTGEIMEVYVSLQNPVDYNNMPTEIYKLKDKKAQVEALKKLGYDGWYADMDTGWGEVSAFYPEQVKSATDNIGTFDRSNKDIRFAIAGEKSRTADINALEQAQEMEQNGYSSEEIHSETGWYRGSDGYWRYEIDNSGMEYHGGDNKDTALSEIITHDELFKAYPELMNVNVVFDNMPKGVKASYSAENNTITLSNDLKNASESSLIHEIQHAVQNIEGFSGGANAEYWQKVLDSGEQIYSKGMNEALQNLIEFEADPDNKMAIEISKDLNRYVLEDRTDEFNELSEWAHDAGLDDKIVQYDNLLFDFENEKYRMTNKDARELYENTAGEIEARDTAKRQSMPADERRAAMPNTGNRDTVFAENGTKAYEIEYDDKGAIAVLNTEADTDRKATLAYLQGLVSEDPFATILNDSQPVYIGKDLPNEYTQSEYTKNLFKDLRNAKFAASRVLGDMLLIAENGTWAEDINQKHGSRAVNGWYYYDTRFAVPIKNLSNETTGYRPYTAQLVIRNDANGKSYLYDIIEIQKELSTIAANGFNHPTIYSRAPSANTDISQSGGDVNTKFALSDDEYGLYDMPPEERTLGDVKKRKLNAFCFDHGEVMTYYKPEAQELLRELSESTRDPELETDSIMRLTEEGGMTYPRIRKALRDIISNPGDEKALNRADVKRVEIELDTRLREGYTDRQGVKIPANSDYVEFVSEIKSETSTNEETYAKVVDKEKQRKKAEALQSLYDRAEAMLNPKLDGYEESAETRERLKQERFEKEQEADNYFYSVNKEEIDNSESRLMSLLQENDPKSGNKTATDDITPQDRTWYAITNREINAFSFDHGEVMQYYKPEAQELLRELNESIRNEGLETGGIIRLTKQDGMTYSRIRKALEDIINNSDDGEALNRADVKRVEIELDTRLREGYTDRQGVKIPANSDYAELVSEIRKSGNKMLSLLKETDSKKRLEYYVDIVAEAQANKERQLRGDTIAKAAENDGYIPDGVEEAEIAAAQELYKQKLAAEKAADEEKYKGMTAEEAEAFKEVEAKRKRAEWLEGAEKKNFIGSEAMDKLGIKISKSTANYKIAANLLEQARANAQLVRDMERQLRKMHATSAERMWAQEIINNTLDVESLPRGADIQRILEASDYLMAKNAARTDLFAKQKVDIRDKARQLAQEKFKNAENAKRISSAKLGYMTPKRAMETMFGEEQGGEIYRTFFESVRENDAEKIRFAEKLRQEAAEIEGADGKKGRLTKGERAVTQMLMEGKAAAEMIARLEMDSHAKVEKAGKRLASGEALSEIKDETVSEETDGKKERVYTVGEDSETKYSTAEIDAALRYAAEITADEAIRTGTYKGESIDTVRVNNAAKYFSDKYDLMYDAINEFLVAHGEQPIGFIKGYAPHTQAKEALEPWDRILQWMGAPTDINELRADIAGETHLRKPNRKWNPHFLNRGYASETDYDVYKGYEDYVDYVSEVFYHMDDIMRLRAASQYLRTMYTTEESWVILKQIEEVRKGNRWEKLAFLQANNQVKQGESFIGTEIDEALDKYADSILRDEENKTAVGSSLVMWLDNYTNLLAGKQNAMDRGLEQRIGRNGIKRINKIINYTIAAQVVGNVSSALNQFAQLPFAITELGAKNTALAIYDIVRNPQEMRRFSMDNDFLTARKGTTILDYKVTDRVTNAMAKPLEVMDWLMSEITARAAYHQGLSQGMDTETAMKYSVQKGEDIMGSRNKASKPVAFTTKNPMFRLINAYQIEALNQWQHIIHDLPKDYKNIAKSKGAKVAAGKLAKDIVTYLICAALINRIADEIYGGSPAPLDLLGITGNFVASGYGLTLNEGLIRVFTNVARGETDGEFDWAAAGETLLSDILDEVPMVDNVLAATGLSDDDTVFVKSVKNLWDGGEKAIDHFFVTKEERESSEQESAEIGEGLLDLVIGASGFIYGGNQLKKTIRGVKAVAEHGNKNESGNLTYPVESNVGNFIKGALFGPSALSKAQEYYASGASPLTSKRNEQYYGMIDMGVDEYDAYKIVQELADIESDKDESGETVSGSKFMNQMNYIESCEVSDDVKDYLALSMASDSAYDRYVENEFEAQGVDPAEFMLGWAFYRSTTGKDKQQQTRQYLKQQGIDEGVINKIISGIK